MLRDFKFLRRNSGKDPNVEETENVPVNPKDSLGPYVGTDSSSRPPLNVIQEPAQNLKAGLYQEVSVRANKIDRTPTKPKGTTSMHLRTSEKQVKNRFGWAQKNESTSNMEMKDEGRDEVSGNISQLRTMAKVITPRSSRTVGRANSSHSDCNSTQNTPMKSVSKPPNPGFCLASGSRPPASGAARMSNFDALSKGIPISYNSVTVVNTVEVPHFEIKEDPSFWLEHSVQTGSGKTHTMLGDIEELEIKPSLNRGMTSRIFEFLFARIRAEEESRKEEKLQYHCKCSFLEI